MTLYSVNYQAPTSVGVKNISWKTYVVTSNDIFLNSLIFVALRNIAINVLQFTFIDF